MALSRLDVKYFKLAVGSANIGKETSVDIVARCPVCGDSQQNKNKKRLHLYNKGEVTNCNCFNGDCAVHNKTVYSFLKEFFPALLESYRRENFMNTMKSIGTDNDSGDVFSGIGNESAESKDTEDVQLEQDLSWMDSFANDSAPVNATTDKITMPVKPEVLVQDFSMFFKPLEDVPEAMEYVKGRMYDYDKSHGSWYYSEQDLKIGDTLYKTSNSIVIPLYYHGVMYGFYSRNISNKTFATYMNDANIGYKVAFWFDINKSEETIIAEGIFDCLSINYDNKVAAMGAKIPSDRLKELSNPIFVLDNDKTGIKNSIEYAKQGYGVYVQPDCYTEKDTNALKINHPNLDIYKLIKDNVYYGISAIVRLKQKL